MRKTNEQNGDTMLIGTLMLTALFFLNFMAGKSQGQKEVIETIRDLEIEDLHRKIDELQRSKR
jgi:hypothetical protein